MFSHHERNSKNLLRQLMEKKMPGRYKRISFLRMIEHLFSSHLICVPSGANLPDTLVNTPIIQSEDGSGLPMGYSASAFALGVNPEDDPELAMVKTLDCN